MTENNSNKQVDLLKWMLEDIRRVTLEGVSHLSREQLFTSPIEGEFPIGAFLMHLSECDIGWFQTISGIKVSKEIKKKSYYNCWYDSGPDYDPPKEPIEIKEYLDTLELTRKMFLDFISTIKDSELEEIITWKGFNGEERKKSKKWIIYHIIEHEAHTRGQMFMLIRKAGWNKR